jgi:glutamate racemase
LDIYLKELLEESSRAGLDPDTLVLGCTHYPLLRANIERRLSPSIRVIDSAEVTAAQVVQALGASAPAESPLRRFYATDSVEKFRALGTRFLGQPIESVELLDLGG